MAFNCLTNYVLLGTQCVAQPTSILSYVTNWPNGLSGQCSSNYYLATNGSCL